MLKFEIHMAWVKNEPVMWTLTRESSSTLPIRVLAWIRVFSCTRLLLQRRRPPRRPLCSCRRSSTPFGPRPRPRPSPPPRADRQTSATVEPLDERAAVVQLGNALLALLYFELLLNITVLSQYSVFEHFRVSLTLSRRVLSTHFKCAKLKK